MALIKCSECGREISERAAQCTGCGAPMRVVAGASAPAPTQHTKPSRGAFEALTKVSALIAALMVIALAWWAPFDAGAERTVDAGLKRAFVTYAAARTLNGVISVAQGTEVTLGVGASTTLSVGEILDPINDAVEQFSDLMLLATISFGIQKMLLLIGGHPYVNYLLTGTLLVALALSLTRRGVPDFVRGVLVLILLARFAVPLATAGSEMVYVTFLEEPFQESSQSIGAATENISSLQGQVADDSGKVADTSEQSVDAIEEKPGLLKRMWGGAKSVAQALNPFDAFNSLRVKMADLKEKAEEIAENLVRLAVIFLLQTLVFPLLFLWGFYYLVRSAVGPRAARSLPSPDKWPAQFKHAVGPRDAHGSLGRASAE